MLLLVLGVLARSKMSTRYLTKTKKIDHTRRKKAGISPVVATVILVAVAVVIAAALAGFAGSLFGSYSNGPQVKVKSMEIDGAAITGTVTLSNAGNQGDSVTNIKINGYTTDTITNGVDNKLAANTDSIPFTFNVAQDTATVDLAPGQQISATIVMQSGAQITQTITVS